MIAVFVFLLCYNKAGYISFDTQTHTHTHTHTHTQHTHTYTHTHNTTQAARVHERELWVTRKNTQTPHTRHTSTTYLQAGEIFAFPLTAFDIEAYLDLIIN